MRSNKVVKHFYNCKLKITKNIISIGNLLIQVYKQYYRIIKAHLALGGRPRFLFYFISPMGMFFASVGGSKIALQLNIIKLILNCLLDMTLICRPNKHYCL